MKIDKHGECNWIGEKIHEHYIYLYGVNGQISGKILSWKPWFLNQHIGCSCLFAFRPMRSQEEEDSG